MAGLGVRLVRRDGVLINLDCTDYMIQINRNVTTVPVPFTAERFGGDLNMVATSIRLNCIIKDDNCPDITASVTSALGSIDFSQTTLGFETTDDYSQITPILKTRLMTGDGGPESRTSLSGSTLTVNARNADGEEVPLTITFNSTADSGTDSADMGIRIDNLSDDKGSTLSGRVRTLIAANTTWSALVTATLEATLRDTGSEKSRVKLTMVNKGGMGAITASPIWSPAGTSRQPSISYFSGGSAQDCFSAGDKVQNLLGSVANNTVLGGVGGLLFDSATMNLDILGNTADPDYVNDYIIGLQLPYNSFSGAVAGTTSVTTPQSYTGKNFIYATGFGNKSKGAASNTQDSSIEFDVSSKYTGVRGTVTSLEFKYNAGNTTYDASITFQPLDLILGV